MVGEAVGTLSLVLLGALVLFTASAGLANKQRKRRADASALVADTVKAMAASQPLQLTSGGTLRRRTTPLNLFGSTGSPLRVI